MKLSKGQRFFIDEQLKYLEKIYKDAENKMQNSMKKQFKNSKTIQSAIASILLKYIIKDNFMSMTKKEIEKEFKRLSKLIEEDFKSQGQTEQKDMKEILDSTIKDIFNHNNYLLNLGISFNLPKVSSKILKDIIYKKIDGLTWSDRLWKNKNILVKILRKDIHSFLEGKINVNSIKKVIKNRFNQNAYNTERLILNEINRVQNEINEEWFNNIRIKYVMYNVTLDNKTTHFCREHDGKVYEVNDPKRPMLPAHILCRSTYSAITDKDYRPKTRMDNETKKIISYVTYEDWLNKNKLN